MRTIEGLSTRFVATIEIGNDAMQTDADVADALRRMANMIEHGFSNVETRAILDTNGNSVGRYGFESVES